MLRTVGLASAVAAGTLLFPPNAGKRLEAQKPTTESARHVPIAKITPRPDDIATIDGIMRAYWEVVSGPAGQSRQWDRDATLYIPGVRFVIITEDKDGNATAQSMTHQEFVDSSEAAMAGKAFYEREIHRVTSRAGNIAHILSTAEQRTSPDGPANSQSIDSIELCWDGRRWWITSANLWEINTKVHPLPQEYLAK